MHIICSACYGDGKQLRQAPQEFAFDDCNFVSKARQRAATERSADVTADALTRSLRFGHMGTGGR